MNEVPIDEFPKMLYKHPEDKTKEQTFITVNNCEEEDQAKSNGYQIEQHIPDSYDENGIKIEPPTENPEVVPVKEDSPKDVLEQQHMNDKPDGEKIEE